MNLIKYWWATRWYKYFKEQCDIDNEDEVQEITTLITATELWWNYCGKISGKKERKKLDNHMNEAWEQICHDCT